MHAMLRSNIRPQRLSSTSSSCGRAVPARLASRSRRTGSATTHSESRPFDHKPARVAIGEKSYPSEVSWGMRGARSLSARTPGAPLGRRNPLAASRPPYWPRERETCELVRNILGLFWASIGIVSTNANGGRSRPLSELERSACRAVYSLRSAMGLSKLSSRRSSVRNRKRLRGGALLVRAFPTRSCSVCASFQAMVDNLDSATALTSSGSRVTVRPIGSAVPGQSAAR